MLLFSESNLLDATFQEESKQRIFQLTEITIPNEEEENLFQRLIKKQKPVLMKREDRNSNT